MMAPSYVWGMVDVDRWLVRTITSTHIPLTNVLASLMVRGSRFDVSGRISHRGSQTDRDRSTGGPV